MNQTFTYITSTEVTIHGSIHLHAMRFNAITTYRDNYNSYIFQPVVWKMWDPKRLTILWASTACYGDRFTFHM
jgi:hypothetical protein